MGSGRWSARGGAPGLRWCAVRGDWRAEYSAINRGNECKPVNGEALARELKRPIEWTSGPEKHRGQVGLRDVDFEVDRERAKDEGISFPLSSIEQAEVCPGAKIRTTIQ